AGAGGQAAHRAIGQRATGRIRGAGTKPSHRHAVAEEFGHDAVLRGAGGGDPRRSPRAAQHPGLRDGSTGRHPGRCPPIPLTVRRMRVWLVVLLLLCGWGAYSWWKHRPFHNAPGVLAAEVPSQEAVGGGTTLSRGHFTLNTRATFAMTGRVLSREDYQL